MSTRKRPLPAQVKAPVVPLAPAPTGKFTIPASTVLVDLKGKPIEEPATPDTRPAGPSGFPVGPDLRMLKSVTLGDAILSSLNHQERVDGLTLGLVERLRLMMKFEEGGDVVVKVETCHQLKLLIKARFQNSPLIGGQVLQLLGDEASEL